MKTLSAPVLAVLAGGAVGIVQLVHLAFSTTPISLNTSNWDLAWGGITYKGAYGLGTVSPVADKPGELQGLTLEVHAASADRLSLALDDADIVQGTVCTIRTAIIDLATYTVLDAPVEWAGTLDTMTIAEDGQTAVVRVTAESRAVDILRGTPWLYTDADQRLVNAADGAFAYVVDQIDKPVVWPARSYYYQ